MTVLLVDIHARMKISQFFGALWDFIYIAGITTARNR
jgi:hypothetical protein